jgi:murein DD-endopeptidase MepM/ murein hydrolase activator NlpD
MTKLFSIFRMPAFLLVFFWVAGAKAFGQFNTLGKGRVAGDTSVNYPDTETEMKGGEGLNDSFSFQAAGPKVNKFHAPLKEVHITSRNGWRIHPVTGIRALHQGIDMRACYESVYAVMEGVVESLGFDDRSGIWIRLRHVDGIKSSYAHLSRLMVKKGETVTAGQVIGISGNSGSSTGPHLHFRIFD